MRKLAVAVALVLSACKPAKEGPRPAPAAPPAAAAGAAPRAPQDIPITAQSFEAVAAFRKGRDLAETFREAEAKPHLLKAVELDPRFAQAHAYLALVDTTGEGLAHVDKAQAGLKELPEIERLWVESVLARALGEGERLATLRRRLAQLAPDNWRVQEQLGLQALGQHRWDEATAALRRAIELNPDADAYNALGYTLASQGKFEEAVAVFKEYVQRKPGEPNPQDSLGEVLMRAGHLKEAEEAFLKAAETEGFWHGWEGAAYARLLRGDLTGGREALAKARAAAQLPGDQLQVDTLLAWTYLIEGKAGEADRRLQVVEKQARDQGAVAVHASLPLDRAVVLLADGKHGEALRQVALAAERAAGPDVPSGLRDALRRRGLVWRLMAEWRLGKREEAERTLAQLAEEARSAPSSAWLQSALHFGRGVLALMRGDSAGALGEMAQCIEDDVYCRWHLSQVQQRAGSPTAAETRAQLLKANWRDPLYLYVRSEIAEESARKTAKR